MKKQFSSKMLGVWYNRLLAVMLVITIGVSVIACQETREEDAAAEIVINEEIRQLEYDLEEPLVVFSEGADGILQNFMNQYPEIELKVYDIGWGGYMPEQFQEAVDQYGNPDIILARNIETGYNIRLEYWYQEGLIEDISKFYEADHSITESDYVPETFQVLHNGAVLLGLPLSWESRCLIIRNSQWEDSELLYLPENYTGRELFTALYNELAKTREEEEVFWAGFFSWYIDDFYEMNAVLEDKNGEAAIDEELFELLFEFHVQREIEDAKELNRSLGTHPAFDPDVPKDRYFGSTLDGAPAVTSIYAKSAAELHGDQVQLYWIPTWDSSDQYVGEVREFALIGGNSTRKQQAYDVIRLMMDMPIEIIIPPLGTNAAQTYTPVNINRALQMLEYYDGKEEEILIKNYDGGMVEVIEKQKLSLEEKKRIQDVITGIESLYFEFDTSEIYAIYSSYVNQYEEGDDINHRQCYFEIMRALNPDSEKWNLTPEEIKAFVNQTE